MRLLLTPSRASIIYGSRRSINDRFMGASGVSRRGREHFTDWLRRFLEFVLNRCNVVVVFQVFQEIADVQEGVAIEANIHKGRLHAGEDSCNAAFVQTSD